MTRCYACDKVLTDDDNQIRAKFDVPDLGQSGYFYFCGHQCLMPWVEKLRQKMIAFHKSHNTTQEG